MVSRQHPCTVLFWMFLLLLLLSGCALFIVCTHFGSHCEWEVGLILILIRATLRHFAAACEQEKYIRVNINGGIEAIDIVPRVKEIPVYPLPCL